MEYAEFAVTVLQDDDKQRFAALLAALSSPDNAAILAAYSISRLQTDNFLPRARAVFGWALQERLVKRALRAEIMRHRDVRDEAIRMCREELSDSPHPFLTTEAVVSSIREAYDIRNGLAHGAPDLLWHLNFNALAHAATLVGRHLAKTEQ